MSGYLLDTNVLSEPTKVRPNLGAIEWLRSAHPDTLHISVITLGEIRRGIDRMANLTKKATLEAFLQALRAQPGPGILPVDEAVAERWGRLNAFLESQGKKLSALDAFIAATALEHDLTIVTRDVRDFAPSGAPLLNPFT